MEKTNWFREHGMILLTGVVIGIAALVLTAHGNPGNMGFCIACFLRDIAGAIGLHSAGKVQYVRPEIIGHRAGLPLRGSGRQGIPGPGRLLSRRALRAGPCS